MQPRRRLGPTALLSACLWVGASACGVGETPDDPLLRVSEQAASERADGQRDDRWVFADGARIDGVRGTREGRKVELVFTYDGKPRVARVGLLAPRDASRQVVSQRPYAPSDDPRASWSTIDLQTGSNTAQLELSEPWFPRSANLVLELRATPADKLVEVQSGPRSVAWTGEGASSQAVDGGRASLALVDTPGDPRSLRVPRATRAPTLDGELNEALWSGEGMRLVSSLEGEPVAAGEQTQVWLAWDDEAIYVAARMRDRDVWGDYAKRDDPIYREEAFEVFFGAGERVHRYLEFQVSPREVVFDAAFTGHRKGGESWNGKWSQGVQVQGTLDERKDRDEGWTVELAFPWSTLCGDTEIECSPRPGTELRMNLFRLDKDAKGRQRGQALTPTRKPDFHNWAAAAHVTLEGGE